MSRLEHEGVIPEEGLSERLLELNRLYSGSEQNGGAFNKTGTVVPRESDDRLKNMHLRQAVQAAATTPQSVPSVPIRTGIPSFDPIRPEEPSRNGHEKWPGEDRFQVGETYIETEKRINFTFSVGEVALRGLKSTVNALKSAKERTANAYAMGNVRLAEARDKIINAFTSPEYKGNRRAVMAVGGLAVAAAGTYLAYKGFAPSGNSASHTHETVANASHHHAAVKETAPAAQHHPKNAGTITKHTRHVAVSLKQASRSVVVKAGDGYTQVIEKLFPGHAPADYLAADKAAIAHQGPGFIHGIGHYKMANGEWGLSGKGKAEVSAKTLRFLRGFFKANQ